MKRILAPALLALSLLAPAVPLTAANPFLDFDFEAAECRGGWPMMGRGYQVAIDAAVAHAGKASLRMAYALPEPWHTGLFAVSAQQFPLADVAGKKIRLSGYIRTAGVTAGYAGFWWRADGEKAPVAFDNMEGRGASGTTPWTRYQIDLDIPAAAKGIYFGVLLDGNGTAWFDEMAVEIDGVRWAEGPPPSPEPPGEAALAWLKARAIPFDTPEAGHGFADLQPLKKVIGGARVVALGEGTHGTREFFQMKHRLTEFLASEMGFTLFAIEANMPEAYRLNDYVLTGKGDPKALLKGMYFWTWDTQEVLDMIEWMRRFNQSGKGRIQFLGFDMQTPTVAAKNARELVAKAEPEAAAKLAEAFAAVERADAAQGPAGPGTVRQPVPGLGGASGKAIRLSGWIKTKDVTEGEAGFSWGGQGFGAPKVATTEGRGAKGTADWQRFELELPTHREVKTLSLEAYLKGKGTAWIDDLAVEIDGAPYREGDLNLGFEAADALAGWAPMGKEYEIAADETVAHSGQRSLRIAYVGDPGDPRELARRAAEAVRTALRRLEERRGAYVARFPAAEVDWALQNARVVLQTAEMLSGETSRDQSMAKNVEWILQQAPQGSKIVLWAHNFHVSRANGAMGTFLTERFGKDMVVLGFAFDHGRYTAVGDKGLDSHEALPAIPSSVESYFHAAGLPRFVLDLRNIPADAPSAAWLTGERPFRSIGALAVRCAFSPTVVSKDYDGLIWFDQTSPSVLLR